MTKLKRRTNAGRHDSYQELTDKIVAALEAGVKPWRRPWDPNKAGGPSAPMNAATGRRYRGINTFVLGISPLAFASQDPRWCSYKQAAERGWQVRRGETSTKIFFYKQHEVKDPTSPEGDDASVKRIPLMRSFSVFHASQIEGIPEFTPPGAPKTLPERIEDAEIILKNSGVIIRLGGDRAFFCPATDHIQLPPDHAFASPEERASSALHELAHASGAAHRLARDLTGKYGSALYSIEELKAELASVFIGNEIGLPSDIPNHASYISSWIGLLKDDRRAIFRAAADAQKIADYLLGFHPAFRADAPEETGENDDEDDHATSIAA
ncbi:Antirestriction protein ArdC [Methylocella tundrae]|uniref:Antirestriction protein ArdC n=1 Tax=Methylocella tundrae TaxID=227605 RepID=A0A8B6M1K8_METTU|nr:zincin-like metallopeptidase domain-containing protein [Methylocella tundrae]VTZ27064.1 Antirestriction protein ArdC [Methylocella tundrae]VTZ48726.1 Antirestriction protein ArdC [Methylocella tundrae]